VAFMSEEKQDKLIDRVRKLLALSKSPNEHEAALAMEKAQYLLKEYNITLTELEVKTFVERKVEVKGKLAKWQAHLASAVATGFDAKVYLIGTRYIVFVGTKVDAEVAQYAFVYLLATVKALVSEYVKEIRKPKGVHAVLAAMGVEFDKKPVKNATSYAYGVVLALETKISEFARKKSETVAPIGSMDLITIKDRELQAFWDKKFSDAGVFSTKQQLDDEAFKKGHADGKDIQIHRGIN